MPKKLAFMYKNKYYLVPYEFNNFESYKLDLQTRLAENKKNRKRTVETAVVNLVEKKCLAPYFVEEFTKTIKLKIHDIEDVYPFEAEVMTMREYNERLRRLVRIHCDGCLRFGSVDETDESLAGHHDEITLDGVCFMRTEEGDFIYTLRNGIFEFVNDFKMAMGFLENLVDSGQQEKAAKEISDMIFSNAMPSPPYTFIGNFMGTYMCVFSGSGNPRINHLLSYFCYHLNHLLADKGWNFFPFIPIGFLTQFYGEPELPTFCIDIEYGAIPRIKILVDKNADEAKTYLAFCDAIGEIGLLNAVLDISFVDTIDNGSEIDELKEAIALYGIEQTGYSNLSFPPYHLFAAEEPNGNRILQLNSIGNIAELLDDSPDDIRYIREFYGLGISFGILDIGLGLPTTNENKPALVRIVNAIEELQSNSNLVCVCKTFRQYDSKLYLMFFDPCEALIELRALSPMLAKYATTLKVISYDKPCQKYRLDFSMEEID